MQILRHKQRHILHAVGELNPPVHLELPGDRPERRAKHSLVEPSRLGRKLDSHEEQPSLNILVLIRIQDIDVISLHQEVDDRHNNTLAVRAINQQDGSLTRRHGCTQAT